MAGRAAATRAIRVQMNIFFMAFTIADKYLSGKQERAVARERSGPSLRIGRGSAYLGGVVSSFFSLSVFLFLSDLAVVGGAAGVAGLTVAGTGLTAEGGIGLAAGSGTGLGACGGTGLPGGSGVALAGGGGAGLLIGGGTGFAVGAGAV